MLQRQHSDISRPNISSSKWNPIITVQILNCASAALPIFTFAVDGSAQLVSKSKRLGKLTLMIALSTTGRLSAPEKPSLSNMPSLFVTLCQFHVLLADAGTGCSGLLSPITLRP
ncbi:hypothetical protein O6P43_012031 [Quillaja saponaria]|uniref:Uncharacterized protein n=1 Tax=Quillaja saponaria TaxID=32244 RepID=A0AAD7M0R9_QUISA|nr:hypothetical protein O6P43_012031 [Quillaja saponaria]